MISLNSNKIVQKKTLKEIYRFIFVGIGSNIINYLIYSFLYLFSGEILISSYFGYLCGMFFSYFLGREWVFRFQSSRYKTLVKFILLHLTSMFVMGEMIYLLIITYDLIYYLAWFISTTIIAFSNFLVLKYYVFIKT